MAIVQKKQQPKNAYATAAAFDKGKNEKVEEKKSKRPLIKIVIFNIINVALVIGTIYLLNQLPKISGEIKKTKSEHLAAQETSDAAVLTADIQKSIDKVNSLQKVFLDADGFKKLLDTASALKGEGINVEISFPGGKPVQNKAKELGLPVLITFQGTLDQVNTGMQRFMSLPYIIEPVNLEVSGTRDALSVDFGGFIRVDEQFAKSQ